LPFAVEIGYISDDTIKFMIGKAATHEKAFEKFAKTQAPKEKVKEENVADADEKKDVNEQNVKSDESLKTQETQTPKENSEENK